MPEARTPGTGPALGIDLGGTKIEAQLLDSAGQTLWRQRVPTPAGDYTATVRAVAALAQAARNIAGGVAGGAAFGAITVGVGSPGAPGQGGRMKNCNSTCLNGQPLHADLQTALGQPVALANDADCLALSEATDGAGAGAAVVFAVILGTGTGAGIAVQGRVLQGPNGLAGEWGHNPLPWADPMADAPARCYCGQSGCLETWLSGSGLARDHLSVTGVALRGEDIAARAAAGDVSCAATLERHAHRLARGLASVVNLLDPNVVVLGGGVSRLPGLLPRVQALWGRWVFGAAQDGPVRTALRLSAHGEASGVRGAAWLGRQQAVRLG